MAFENITQQLASINPALASAIQQNPALLYLLALQIIMKAIFYPIALYVSAKKQQKVWFVVLFICLLFLNDFGALPILYLVFNKYAWKQKQKFTQEKRKKKR